MYDVAMQCVVGVVSGVFSAWLIYLMHRAWKGNIVPLIESTQYSGVLVDGSWRGEGRGQLDDGSGEWSTELNLQLKQSATALSGIFHISHSSPKNRFRLANYVTGRIGEGYVVLSLKPVDRRVTSVGTVLLKVDGGGSELRGKMLYRNVFADTVTAEDVHLLRLNGSATDN